jgi:hypothetical protein
MEMIWFWMTGVVTGGLIVALAFHMAQKKALPVSLGCVRRSYFGPPVTSDVAERGRLALVASRELSVVLDFLVASTIDDATSKIHDSCAGSLGYGPSLAEAVGIIKGAEAMAKCIEDLASGDLVKRIAEEEQRRLRAVERN